MYRRQSYSPPSGPMDSPSLLTDRSRLNTQTQTQAKVQLHTDIQTQALPRRSFKDMPGHLALLEALGTREPATKCQKPEGEGDSMEGVEVAARVARSCRGRRCSMEGVDAGQVGITKGRRIRLLDA